MGNSPISKSRLAHSFEGLPGGCWTRRTSFQIEFITPPRRPDLIFKIYISGLKPYGKGHCTTVFEHFEGCSDDCETNHEKI